MRQILEFQAEQNLPKDPQVGSLHTCIVHAPIHVYAYMQVNKSMRPYTAIVRARTYIRSCTYVHTFFHPNLQSA